MKIPKDMDFETAKISQLVALPQLQRFKDRTAKLARRLFLGGVTNRRIIAESMKGHLL